MRRGTTFDFWPAVADFFVGILAVIVFVFIGHKPIDPQIEAFREELKTQLDRDKVSGLVREYDLRPSSVRIVYSAQALSFQTCEWKLPEEKANLVRAHLRLLG